MERRELGRRSLAGRPNGTLDPYYGCSLLGEMWDYAVNYTYPWSTFAYCMCAARSDPPTQTRTLKETLLMYGCMFEKDGSYGVLMAPSSSRYTTFPTHSTLRRRRI
jgi:hypothetical protein